MRGLGMPIGCRAMPTTALETLNLHLDEGLLTVELNRPDSLNAWIRQTGQDLLDARRTGA
jgi:hypothetical protein